LVERAGVRQRPGSHVIMVSKARAVAGVIMAAAAAVDRPTVGAGGAK
jgi:hypothetical protein